MLDRIDRMLAREWTADRIAKYIGSYQKSYFTYAADEIIRDNAASGGTVTALLASELRAGTIDGALVVQSFVLDGKVETRYVIARDEQTLYDSQGSKYITVRFASHAVPLIKAFEGRLAAVLLPCDALILKRMREKDPVLDQKMRMVITLFCGHNSEPELTRLVTDKLRPGLSELVGYRHRVGYWRGRLRARYANGAAISKPFSYFSDYQNLYFYCEKKCLHCIDQTGYYSDLSIGDIWSLKMKNNPIKHNAVIARTEAGLQAIARATDSGALVTNEVPIEAVCDGQTRSLPLHYNISARAKVSRVFGENIRDTVQERVRPIEFILAFFILANVWFSHTGFGGWLIPRLPRVVIKGYLYFMKALQVL